MKKVDHRRLKAARLRLGLTQREAADQIGVPSNTWSRWERGEVRPQGLNLRAVLAWLEKEREQREGGQ